MLYADYKGSSSIMIFSGATRRRRVAPKDIINSKKRKNKNYNYFSANSLKYLAKSIKI